MSGFSVANGGRRIAETAGKETQPEEYGCQAKEDDRASGAAHQAATVAIRADILYDRAL